MWLLKVTSTSAEYILPCNKDIVVGRKDADIVIAGDSSVSRKHATLRIDFATTDLKNPNANSCLALTDLSKFGTFVTKNGEKTKVQNQVVLQSGDLVQLGALESFFEVRQVPIVITTSMLGNDAKQKLQQHLFTIGGHLVSNWHEKVTHLIVDKIKLSVKMTLALVNACHVVTPNYIFGLKPSVEATSIIQPEQFMPELAEPNLSQDLCSFKPDVKRKGVFKRKIFVHISKKQQNRLGQTISCGGGKSILADDLSIDEELLTNPDTAVVAFSEAEQPHAVLSSSQYKNLQDTLSKMGHRFVAEHEIGLAVLYCDASVYCNPTFDLNSQNAFTQQTSAEINIESSCEVSEVSQKATKNTAITSASLDKPESSKLIGTSRKSLNSSPTKNTGLADETESILKPKEVTHYSAVLSSGRKRSRTPESSTTVDENLDDRSLKKKSKRDDEKEMSPYHPACQDLSQIEDIPDSCLDDDQLWSQNFNSASYRLCEEERDTNTSRNIPEKKTIKTERNSSPFINLDNQEKHASDQEILIDAGNRVQEVIKQEIPSPEVFNKPKSEVLLRRPVEETNHDPSLPKNPARVDFCNLISNRNRHHSVECASNSGGKNFKKFVKIWPTYLAEHMPSAGDVFSAPPLPHIIGGSDFFVNVPQRSRNITEWFHEETPSADPFAEISNFR